MYYIIIYRQRMRTSRFETNVGVKDEYWNLKLIVSEQTQLEK